MRMTDLHPGWAVVTNDDHRLGRIRDVRQHFIEVSGGLFSGAIYIPASAIANVEHETVYLNLANAEVSAMGWQQAPRSADELHTAPERDVDRDV